MELIHTLEIEHLKTAYNHPEGNGMIERFFRTLKEEEVWLNEYENFQEAKERIEKFIHFYNTEKIHQSLGYRTPHESYMKALNNAA